ncbi:MAG: response regulator [Patescibacteria group bacterium]|nr:response regulator [Patescibacteria group bacterium]
MNRGIMSELGMLLKEKSILLVEDDRMLREIYRDMLLQFTPAIRTAENGRQGLEMFFEETPDLIITDNDMPFVTGTQMITQILESDPGQKVLLMSGSLDEIYSPFVRYTGFGYIPKPFNATKLTNKLIEIYDS